VANYSNEDYLLDLVQEAGVLSPEQLSAARDEVSLGHSVVTHLIKNGIINEVQVAQVCAHASSMDYVDRSTTAIPPNVFDKVPVETAKRFHTVPIHDDGTFLTMAISDPLNFEVLDTLPHVLGREIIPVCSTHTSISEAMKHFYGIEDEVEEEDPEVTVGGAMWDADGSDGEDAPIVKLVNGVLVDAFKLGASDIHIEPVEACVRIRYRVDGKLTVAAEHPKKLLPAMIARLKVMSQTMSIAEKRLPQDGRIQMSVAGKDVDLRVSSVPSNHGESIVMRILDKSSLNLGMDQLGFLSDDQEIFRKLIGLPDGIILVTGPTGSGKTTTLYSCLNQINRPDKKIITVEDPVEYEMSGINQVMVKPDIGMTFGAALRAMLRQAPNIIMVGEIRDAETANISINASLTGHLVFSTLHTNDAPSAIARLADIGVKRFLIASALRAVMAQRLVRKLCPSCKAPAILNEKDAQTLGVTAAQTMEGTIFGPQGCDQCRDVGYRGRMGLFEILQVDDEICQLINQNLTTPSLKRRAREMGMRTLREDGVRKVLSGLTSTSEVLGSTMNDK